MYRNFTLNAGREMCIRHAMREGEGMRTQSSVPHTGVPATLDLLHVRDTCHKLLMMSPPQFAMTDDGV